MAGWIAARKDLLGGLLMFTLGAVTALEATSYNLGTLRRMGPGFFPLALGVLLAIVGVLIVATARRTGSVSHAPEWRGWFCICASIGAFVVLGRYGGLVPATFAIVAIAALGDRDNSVSTALGLAAVMTALGVVVFWWLLGVAFPLFRWGSA